MEEEVKSRIKIRLGHIGPTEVTNSRVKILNQLLIITDNNDHLINRIISRSGCSYSFESAIVATEMYYKDGIRAFIGPYCSVELDVVAKMASFWNTPLISYTATNDLVDKRVYRTLARISSTNINSIAQAVATLLIHYQWFKIAIATNIGASDQVFTFENVFKKQKIITLKKIIFEENSTTEEMLTSGLLDQLRYKARIVICLFAPMLEMSRNFMAATFSVDMHSHEFVYILPWIREGKKNTLPWLGDAGEIMQKVKEHYENAILGFRLLLPISNFNEMAYSYLHVHDAIILYSNAVKAVLNETKNLSTINNGQLIWNKMRHLQFNGATGPVIMDDLADRVFNLVAFYVSPRRNEIQKIINISSKLRPNCNGLLDDFGCYDLISTDLITGFWPSEDGSMPPDEPSCGFGGEKCSHLLKIILGISLLTIAIVAVVFHFSKRYCESRALYKMPWRVYKNDLKILNEEELKSMISFMSIKSTATKFSEVNIGQKKHAIVGVNNHTIIHTYPQRRNIKFGREDLQLLSQMKAVVHDNLNTFVGMVFNECEDVYLVWKFCSRGTIQDIIYDPSINLHNKFHASFIRDITLGLEYLHSSPIGYHGSLSPWACLIDRNWMIKLTDFGIANPIERWTKQGWISVNALTSDDDKSGPTQKTSVLYCAPELLKNREVNRRAEKDQSWVKQSKVIRQASDIYSFGMIMYEILYQSLPFPENTDINELIDMIADGSKTVPPRIMDSKDMHPDLYELLVDCWSENIEIRPTIRRIRRNTETLLKAKGSLVDQMMSLMEQYATNLEKLVAERTGMLEEANNRADKLLSQLLPSYVANELKLGRSVPPKLFDMATVLFSDIVGFTSICSASTPLEVVTMLNGLYRGFDECISQNGAYKVETIGDAYMVVSGIPEENGIKHIHCIADVALAMRNYLQDYHVPHRTDKLQCRWGFHTGPVAAGVVGLTAPRYCLFGDTVNEASRMESTGLPGKIQISTEARELLAANFPNYIYKERGKVEIKVFYILKLSSTTLTKIKYAYF
ncbi:unnamed protein product [Thelazia callipaeda]|uniref:Guanylate cyclase n=1 Tax=Thelazia callipaeda TaxID=103827 RepID=A0A0N5CY30_THECL|nr:unnamed protein product [Thelazia callipaeda]